MNKLSRYLSYSLFFTLAVLASCSKDNENPSVASINSSIKPNDYLSEQKYTSLTIEIKFVNGYAPTSNSLDNLKSFLTARLNKSAGITFTQSGVASPGKTTLALTDIENLEKANRSLTVKDKALVAYFYFSDAAFTEDTDTTKVLGAAYGNSSMIIFEKTIRSLSGGLGRPSAATLESIVLEHEFSHILGLVNNGTNLQSAHQDVAHGKHCNNTNCLMNYKTESSLTLGTMQSIPVLDAACLEDLKANGGK